MKSKIFLMSLTTSFSIVAVAQTEFNNQTEFLKAAPEMTTGVMVVPPSQMDTPPGLQNKYLMENKEMRENGFIKSDSLNAKNLMSIKERAPSEKPANQSDPYNYYLRKDVSEIKLAFDYKGISDSSSLIGFAPGGEYIKEGWTGIKEYFENKELGVCSLALFHLNYSNMSIKINADEVSYIVNNKPTTIQVKGSKKSGFLYMVSWADNVFSKDLVCASMKYDKRITQSMVTLANHIDKF